MAGTDEGQMRLLNKYLRAAYFDYRDRKTDIDTSGLEVLARAHAEMHPDQWRRPLNLPDDIGVDNEEKAYNCRLEYLIIHQTCKEFLTRRYNEGAVPRDVPSNDVKVLADGVFTRRQYLKAKHAFRHPVTRERIDEDQHFFDVVEEFDMYQAVPFISWNQEGKFELEHLPKPPSEPIVHSPCTRSRAAVTAASPARSVVEIAHSVAQGYVSPSPPPPPAPPVGVFGSARNMLARVGSVLMLSGSKRKAGDAVSTPSSTPDPVPRANNQHLATFNRDPTSPAPIKPAQIMTYVATGREVSAEDMELSKNILLDIAVKNKVLIKSIDGDSLSDMFDACNINEFEDPIYKLHIKSLCRRIILADDLDEKPWTEEDLYSYVDKKHRPFEPGEEVRVYHNRWKRGTVEVFYTDSLDYKVKIGEGRYITVGWNCVRGEADTNTMAPERQSVSVNGHMFQYFGPNKEEWRKEISQSFKVSRATGAANATVWDLFNYSPNLHGDAEANQYADVLLERSGLPLDHSIRNGVVCFLKDGCYKKSIVEESMRISQQYLFGKVMQPYFQQYPAFCDYKPRLKRFIFNTRRCFKVAMMEIGRRSMIEIKTRKPEDKIDIYAELYRDPKKPNYPLAFAYSGLLAILHSSTRYWGYVTPELCSRWHAEFDAVGIDLSTESSFTDSFMDSKGMFIHYLYRFGSLIFGVGGTDMDHDGEDSVFKRHGLLAGSVREQNVKDALGHSDPYKSFQIGQVSCHTWEFLGKYLSCTIPDIAYEWSKGSVRSASGNIGKRQYSGALTEEEWFRWAKKYKKDPRVKLWKAFLSFILKKSRMEPFIEGDIKEWMELERWEKDAIVLNEVFREELGPFDWESTEARRKKRQRFGGE